MAHTRAIVKGGFLDGDDFGPRLSEIRRTDTPVFFLSHGRHHIVDGIFYTFCDITNSNL